MVKGLIASCLFLIVVFAGCTKLNDNTPAPTTPSLSSILTAKSWKFSGESRNNTNIWRNNDTCNSDAIFKFNTNFTYTYVGCDSSDAYEDSTAGHWAFLNSNQNSIVFHPKTTAADTFQVTVVSSSVLVFEQYQYALGSTYSETFLAQ